jgi:PucR family transcriptional regulator, purine catabolism regulatory protein
MNQLLIRKDNAVNALSVIASEILRLSDDVDSVLNLIVEKTKQFLNSDSSHIILYDDSTHELYIKTIFGFEHEDTKETRAPADAGMAGWIFREKKPLICVDYDSDPHRSQAFADAIAREGIKQLLGVPLFADEGNIIGVLFASNRSNYPVFSDEDVALAMAFANLASVALQNAGLYLDQRKTLAKLEILNNKLSYSNNLLKQSIDIHKQFIITELKGEGTSTIAGVLAQLVANPVIVEDRLGNILAVADYNGALSAAKLDGDADTGVLGLARIHAVVKEQLGHLAKNKQHVWIPKVGSSSPIRRRLVAPINVENEVLGYVSALEISEKLCELSIVAIQYASLMFALDMTKQKAVFEAEQRTKGDLLSWLLSGDTIVEEDLLKRASYLGYDLTIPRLVMVMRLDDEDGSKLQPSLDTNQRKAVLDNLFRAVHKTLTTTTNGSIAAIQNNEIVILLACDRIDEDFSLHLPAGNLAKTMKLLPKQISTQLTASIGVGSLCLKLTDYVKAYNEARKALEISRWIGKKNEIVPMRSLGVYGLLFEPQNYQRLIQFSHDSLDALIHYDQKHKSNLIATLSAFLSCNCSLKTTATLLFIHENTLRQRLERIQDLCKLNIRDANDKFALQLALKVWELKNHK